MPVKLTPGQARQLGLTGTGPKRRRKVKATGPGLFQAACRAHGLPVPVSEWQFDPKRKWKFDFAWVHIRLIGCTGIHRHDPGVALEIDGGVYTGGRHTRGAGFIADQEKRNRATIMGWKVLHCTPADVKSGAVFVLLREVLT